MEYLSPPSTPCKNKRKLNTNLMTKSSEKYRHPVPLESVDLMDHAKYRKLNCDSPLNPLTPMLSEKRDSRFRSDRITSGGDRFIPQRNNLDFDHCHHSIYRNNNEDNVKEEKTTSAAKYNQHIMEGLSPSPSRRLLPLFDKGSAAASAVESDPFRAIRQDDVVSKLPLRKQATRNLPTTASRVLDAPDLIDDYYLNLLHWGSSNSIAVALGASVFLWNASNGQVDQLLSLESDYIGSVKWSTNQSNLLAVGTNHNTVQIWDASKETMVREMPGHSARVGSLSWNGDIISSGSKDSIILNHDIRQRRNIVSRYCGHQQEICGLSWSPDGSTLASGGNENMLCIWDPVMSSQSGPLQSLSDHKPRFTINEHQAAVKALAWCPWLRNTLASGGGTADRSIRIWNSSLGSNLKVVDTGSQVCALEWNVKHRELLSSHGFSDNQLILWDYPSMTKLKEFRGHTARVLHLAQSPDHETICSASADETLRFWDIFSGSSSSGPSKSKMLSPVNISGKSALSLSLSRDGGNLVSAVFLIDKWNIRILSDSLLTLSEYDAGIRVTLRCLSIKEGQDCIIEWNLSNLMETRL